MADAARITPAPLPSLTSALGQRRAIFGEHHAEEPTQRRSFLRGLAALPFVGGAVALIGQPVAAAVPSTDALHERYFAWLAHEHRAAMKEHAYRTALFHARRRLVGHVADCEAWARAEGERACYMDWMPKAPDIKAGVAASAPSTRAAVILSAAGVALTGAI